MSSQTEADTLKMGNGKSVRTSEAIKNQCRWCGEIFSSFKLLLQHKSAMLAKNVADNKLSHIHCFICGADFRAPEAVLPHVQLFHPQEQSLRCPICDRTFVRMSGFVQHLEKDCGIARKTLMKPTNAEETGHTQLLHKTGAVSVREGHRREMGAGYSNINHTLGNYGEDFPKIASRAYRDGDAKVPDLLTGDTVVASDALERGCWGSRQEKKFFPNAPDPMRPTVQQLQATRHTDARAEHVASATFNPAHRDFNIMNHYNKFTDKFTCPYPMCSKTFPQAKTLRQHLLDSSTHSRNEMTCPSCLNTFKTASALAQHSEAEGSKCRGHRAVDFAPFTDRITGGLVDMAGEHEEDETRKYVVSDEARLRFASGPQNPAELIKERVKKDEAARRLAKDTYWERNNPTW